MRSRGDDRGPGLKTRTHGSDAVKIELPSSEGIYYVVRYPDAWSVFFQRFSHSDPDNHYEWWQQTVAAIVGTKWELRLGRKVNLPTLKLLTYGFPRGRVSKVGRKFVIFHGADFTDTMHELKQRIEEAFGISGKCLWRYDDHERCQREDKDELRRILRIEEDWLAV